MTTPPHPDHERAPSLTYWGVIEPTPSAGAPPPKRSPGHAVSRRMATVVAAAVLAVGGVASIGGVAWARSTGAGPVDDMRGPQLARSDADDMRTSVPRRTCDDP